MGKDGVKTERVAKRRGGRGAMLYGERAEGSCMSGTTVGLVVE